MKEKKKSAVSWILTWAGQKRIAYVWSVLLAIGNVIFKILPYFIIADVVKLFLNGEKEFEIYLAKAVLIALSFIIAELLHSLSTALSHKATFAVLANIRKSCCDKLARVPLGYVKDTPSGTFKNIMVERIDSIETTLAHIVPEFTSNLLAPIVILIYFFLTDWRLALWSLVPVIVGFLSYFGMMLDYKPSFERTVQTTKDLNDAAVEYIDGIEVIKAFGKTESSYAKFTKAAFEYADSFISWMKRCSIFHALMMVVTPYTLLTVLPFGAHYVANGTLAISDFVICIILSLGIVGPLITVGSYTDDLGKIGVIVGEVAGILEQPELERPEKSKSVPKDNSVTLEDVRFGYHDKEILHGVTMELKAGTVNAIVGPSGSGKSTIAKLIASLWDADSGSIKIGGVDVKELAFADFNRKIAYVAQDNYLFNETVRENIRQGNPEATDEQIIEVTKKSGCCHDFISKLPNGYDTVIGEGGATLSGGEKQRISIARAIMKDAPIVILDEATANVDPENEKELMDAVDALTKEKTIIMIAHRLKTVRHADQIVVVEKGRIAQQGTHEQLMKQEGIYKRFVDARQQAVSWKLVH